MKTISAAELHERLSTDRSPCLIDVRQVEELQYGVLKGAHLFPMQEISAKLDEIKFLVERGEGGTVVYCRSGGRSRQVIEYLENNGFSEMLNLDGGILAYSVYDPAIKIY